MTDVFEEVEEGLRQDKASSLWKKYGAFVIGGIVLVVGGVAAWEYYSWQKAEAIDRDARVYSQALFAFEDGDIPAAKSGLEALAQDKDGFAVLANHMLAEIEKDGDSVGAASAARLERAIEIDAESPLGRLALLKLAYAQADALDRAALATLVQPLVTAGGAEGALAKELLAAKTLASGDIEAARGEYQVLSLDLDAPQNMKIRVNQTLATMPARPAVAPAATDPGEPADETPADASAQPNQ